MKNIQNKRQERLQKLNVIFKAVTAILLLTVLCMAMIVSACMDTEKELWEQAQITLDVRQICRINVGDSFIYTAKVTPADAKTVPLQSPLFSCEEIKENEKKLGQHTYRITALKVGTAKAGASAGNKTAAFTVKISQGITMADRAQSYTSNTDYLILTDLKNQRVGIFIRNQGMWKQVKDYTCSSGAAGFETPKGEYTVQERGAWFYNRQLESGAKWWVRFYGPYLFHSLEMDEQKNIKDTRLGMPLSHGCIRMNIEEAKWFYEHVSYGSKVVIY